MTVTFSDQFQSADFASTLFNDTINGIVIIDPATHCIQEINSTAEAAIGGSRDQIIGKVCHQFMCPACEGDCPVTDNGIDIDRSERILVRADGTQIPIMKTVVRKEIGGREFLVESFIDQTEQKAAELETQDLVAGLQDALTQIKVMTETKKKEADQRKRDLVAVVSHEIRTPLNGIMGMNQILSGTSLTDEQKEYTNIIENSAHHLLEVLNGVLDFTKIDAGERNFEQIPFNLCEILDRTSAVFSHYEEKHLEFLYFPRNLADIWVIGDPTALRQIIFNLLNNAFKFTQRGEVSLTADYSDSTLTMIFTDTGIGIPTEKQKMIFQPFKQVDESKTRIYGGTGLGLAVTKALIETQGGTVAVESKVGKGTRFTVTLPLPRAKRFDVPIKQCGEKAFDREPAEISVLIVDDNPVNQKITGRFVMDLKGVRSDCTFASNGLEAVELAGTNRYDFILMDIMMPVMCGEEATKMIRRFDNHRNSPIIALTAEAVGVSKAYYRQFGFCDYISKPFDKTTLENIIKSFVSVPGDVVCKKCRTCYREVWNYHVDS